MQFGLSMFITDETIAPVDARPRGRGRRLRRDLRPRAHAHPRQPREPLAGRRRAPARVLAHARSVRVAERDRGHHERLRVGTGIALIVERDPIIARPRGRASLDHLSGGRFELGIGAGWNLEEMRNHGTDPARALRGHARARAGHARDLDAGRGLLPRRVRRLRAHLVVAQAGPDARCRCGSAAPGRACSTACSSTATAGSRTCATSTSSRRASPSCSSAPPTPAASASRSPTSACATPTTRSSTKMAAAGVDRVLLMLPPKGRDESLPRVERYAELAARHR